MNLVSSTLCSFSVPLSIPELVCFACLYTTNVSFVHVHAQIAWTVMTVVLLFTAIAHLHVGGIVVVACATACVCVAPIGTIFVLSCVRVAGTWKKTKKEIIVTDELENQYSDANVESGLTQRFCF